MPKNSWPTPGSEAERQANTDLTNPDALRKAMEPIFGEQVAAYLRDHAADVMRTLGLDNIDREHLRIPGASKMRFTDADLMAGAGWNVEGTREKRRHLMQAWFRSVLFGKGLTDILGDDCEVSESVIRTLSSTESAGGYLIPPGYIAEITRDVPKLSKLFQYVRKMPVSEPSGVMPKVGTNASVSWGTENNDFGEGDPAFGESTYSVNRMNAFVALSREIANDSNPDIIDVVVELFQEAIAEERDRVIAVGSGSGRPLGLYSATGITNVAITALSYDALVNLKESIDERYHSGPTFRWFFNQSVKAALMKLKDNDDLPIFQTARTDREPGQLLGVPYSVENSFPNNYLGIGDLRYYVWFDRKQMGVERSTEAGDAFRKHQVHIKFWERVDGKPIIPATVPFARTRVLAGITDPSDG